MTNLADQFKRKIPPRFDHQNESKAFFSAIDRGADASDPGTGKTRVHIDVFMSRTDGGKALVLAPKAILRPAWGNDITNFAPSAKYVIASAKNRATAFKEEADFYITNHDAVNWLAKQPASFFAGFTDLIVDEITAFKHRTSLRSKSLAKIVKHFKRRYGLTGTPNSNTITDVWHQTLLLDDGERLGNNFWKFRQTVCEPVQVGPQVQMVKWVDREGSAEAVADLLDDMTIRHKFEECTSIPPNVTHTVYYELSAKHRKQWDTLKNHMLLEAKTGEVAAFSAGSLRNKLLQLASGAVYDDEHEPIVINTDRYKLVLELVAQRTASIVAFNWTHERDELVRQAEKRKITYAVIDGDTKDDARDDIITRFQAGLIQVIFAHPKSASHGLTLTRGVATIWCSPCDDGERYYQFNRRIYRTGQTQATETIHIAARDTLDEGVYNNTDLKLDRMDDFLVLLESI